MNVSPKEGLAAAFIGYSNHAERVIRLVQASPLAGRLLVYHPKDRGSEVRRLFGNTVDFSSDFGAVSRADIAFVLSPNHTHFGFIQKLLKRGSAMVYCEKPPVASVAQAKSLLAIDNSLKSRIYWNFNYRHSRLGKLLCEVGDKYGPLLHISIAHTHGLAFKSGYLRDWRSDKDQHGLGVLETAGIHYLDLVNACLSPITHCRSTFANYSGRGSSADTALCSFSLENGASGSLLCSYAAPYQRSMVLTFANAIVSASPTGLIVRGPRDVFDRHGRFDTPPVEYSARFNLSDDIKDSLRPSVDYFLETCASGAMFPVSEFDQRLYLTSKILASAGRRARRK